jgi:hypothetical protein
MVFRRTYTDIPQDADFPEDLAKLGFKINIGRHVVEIEDPKQFFQYNKYEKKKTNQKRYNAVQKAVRAEVYKHLATIGLQSWYLTAGNDDESHYLVPYKPAGPSLRILSTPRFSRSENKDLYLIVPDSKQELAIWSRQTLLTEGGLIAGSAMGLAHKLRTPPHQVESLNRPKTEENKELDLAAVIILNPGEPLFSHQSEDCMSSATWHDRAHEHGFSDQYKVTDEHNRIPGHRDSLEHVMRAFRGCLQNIVGYDTKMNIITIGNGSEGILLTLDHLLQNPITANNLLALQISISMIQPSHNEDIVTTQPLKELLAKHGQIWEAHSSPKGTLITDLAPELRSLADYVDDDNDEESLDTYKFRHDVATLNDFGLQSEQTRALARPRAASKLKPHVMESKKLEVDRMTNEGGINHSRGFDHWMAEDAVQRLSPSLRPTVPVELGEPSEFSLDALALDAVHSRDSSNPLGPFIPYQVRNHIDEGQVVIGYILDSDRLAKQKEDTAPNTGLESAKDEQNKDLAPVEFDDENNGGVAVAAYSESIRDRNREGPIPGAYPGSVIDEDIGDTVPISVDEDEKREDSPPANHPRSAMFHFSDNDELVDRAAPEGHHGLVVTKENSSEEELTSTPPGAFSHRRNPIDYFRGPGLTMALHKKPDAVVQSKAQRVVEVYSGTAIESDTESDDSIESGVKLPTGSANATSRPIIISGKKNQEDTEKEKGKGEDIVKEVLKGVTKALDKGKAIATVALSTATVGNASNLLALVLPTKEKENPTDSEKDNINGSFQYNEAYAHCRTYSAGIEDVTEMLFPAVMDEVLLFFKEQEKKFGVEKKRARERRE